MQKEPTPAEKAYRFCTHLIHFGHDDFYLLLSVLGEVNKKHIVTELLKICTEG